MEKEIKEIIAKNLPQHVGDVLKSRLEEADRLQNTVISLQEEKEYLKEQIGKLKEELAKEKNHTLSEETIKLKEQDVKDRERNLELTIANMKLSEMEKRNLEMLNIVQAVFKSPVYRKHVSNDMFYSYDATGRQIVTGGTPRSIVEEND